jgi:hypothetical protein
MRGRQVVVRKIRRLEQGTNGSEVVGLGALN